ncbi:MAG: hypothetical protein KF774_04645 [Planctomyces sp.]|nr:hypothetical protein [Planctomyces sp.]
MPLFRKLSTWLIGIASMSGCYQLNDCVNQHVSSCCNRHYAMKAWCACRGNYVDCQDYLWDFGAGFRQGYADVAGGADGCVPTLPPRKYWGACYQNDDGRCAVAAWFDGYQHGAAVALADGAGGYSRIVTSDDIYQKCGQAPISIDLDQYKASRTPSPAVPTVPMDGHLPPYPEPVYGAPVPPIEPPYSPQVAPVPDDAIPNELPEDFGPSARYEGLFAPSR